MAKILVIDDEAAILNLMAKSCRQQGHEVTAVQTGREGIEALDRFKPEMMIVDLLIGDMTDWKSSAMVPSTIPIRK